MSDSVSEQYENLLLEKRGSVDWLTLNRPDSLNALNPGLTRDLSHYFTSLRRDKSVRVVVLKAAGRAFCAGADLSDFSDSEPSIGTFYDGQTDIADIMKAMRRCPQPVISLLNGAVCGGGFTLALSSDIRIATPDCKMNAAFIKIGLTGCDMGSSYLLPRLVGTSVASELLLTGRFIYADRALAVNLVSAVVERDSIEQAAQVYIDEMLATTPMGLRMTKECLNYSVDAPSLDAAMAMEDRHQVLLTQTEDHVEAVSAFFEKRAPSYRDK